jgi:thiol-disulfide isomerase/thioredoxin
MKVTAMISVLLFSVFTFSATASDIDFINNDFTKALKKAQNEGKMIFVDAYASWCGPCKYMSANVFTDDEVAALYNTNFINLKLDVESSEGESFQKDYPIDAMPTFYVIDKKGKVVKKKVGAMNKEEFLKFGHAILEPEKTDFFRLTKEYEQGRRDKEFLYELIEATMDEGKDATSLIDEYFSGMAADALLETEPFVLFYASELGFSSALVDYFGNNYDEMLDLYGEYAQEKLIDIINFELDKAVDAMDKSYLGKIYAYVKKAIDDEEAFASLKEEIESVYDSRIASQ